MSARHLLATVTTVKVQPHFDYYCNVWRAR